MTLDDVQKNFHYYRNLTPVTLADGTVTTPDGKWYDLPIDIVINSQKAFSSDPTVFVAPGSLANGHPKCKDDGTNANTCGGPAAGARYFAPPTTLTINADKSVTGCVRIFAGDCSTQPGGSPRQQFVTAPIFTRFDFSAKKSFPFARHSSLQVEMDVLNVFNAIDFNNAFSGTGGSNNVTSAYSDINNTFDPGGRLGQLVVRVNW